MSKPQKTHAIIDKEHIVKRIGKTKSLTELRFAAMPLIGEAYAYAKDSIKQRFVITGKGEHYVAENAHIIDEILVLLAEIALPYCKGASVSIVAVGGYGRGELFPSSDVDILFLQDKKRKENAAFIEWLMYCLWDIGLTIGQSVRTVDDTIAAAKKDINFCTSLLDARLVIGEKKLFDKFQEKFSKYTSDSSSIDFVEAKLFERDARHLRCNDSRYVLEPNLKEGKGGLRDLHTLYWIAKYIYRIKSTADLVELHVLDKEEYKSFIMAQDFLWTVRVHLHLIANRAEEHLTFDMQRAVAEAMGYNDDSTSHSVERFMKQYFLVAKTVGNLTRSVCAVLEENGKRKPRLSLASRMKTEELGEFHLDGERIAINSPEAFKKNPVLLIKLFQVAHERELDIHPDTFRLVTRSLWLIDAGLRRNVDANQAFMDILLSKHNPEMTLRRMSESGVLGKFIPDFGRVTGQMQFDMYHVFTVDEHIIFAIGILHNIGRGKYKDEMPIVSEIYHSLKSYRVLYLALLTHDIAKGRGGNHSVLGEVVVRKLGRRFRLDEYEIETCAWLVRQHLLMSRTAFKRDLADGKTIDDFVSEVQSPERLRLLLLLTVADIRAVGPHVWNGWKGALLRELYYAAEEKMGAGERSDRKVEMERIHEDFARILPKWKSKDIEHYFDLIGKTLAPSFDAETHVRIATLLKAHEKGEKTLVMDTKSDIFLSNTDIILCTEDSIGLFSKTSGAISLSGANITSAKIFTLKNGVAIQMFNIQDADGKPFDKHDRLQQLEDFMNAAVEGKIDLGKEIAKNKRPYPSRMEAFKIPPHVYIENRISNTHTVIEVSGRDRIGFLYMVTSVLVGLDLTISTAHISTYGERAVDVFYVKDVFGMKIYHESKIRQIQEALTEALSGAGGDKVKRAS